MKTLSVSVAQITCIDNAVEQNLSHAYELANEASKNGAELVLSYSFNIICGMDNCRDRSLDCRDRSRPVPTIFKLISMMP